MRSRLAPLLLAPLVVACTHLEVGTAPRAAPTADVPTPAYYDVGRPPSQPTTVEVRWRKPHHELWRIELPPHIAPDVADVPHVGDAIEILYMFPRPSGARRRPLILMFPILGNGTLLMGEAASGFVHQGYLVAIVPRKEVAFDPVRSVTQAEKEFRVSIMRARQALDWLVTQPRVDPERLAVFGISAGGILGLDLMAADPRIDAGVAVFAGGPMADVIAETEEGRFVERRRAVRAARGWSDERQREVLRGIIRTDPVVLAPRIRREDVLLFIATDDTSVPTSTQRALWEALGRPEAHEIPGGHYTGVGLFFPFLLQTSKEFLGQRLGRP